MQGIWTKTAKFGLNVEICPLFCCYVVSNEQNSPRVGPSNTQNELCITRSSLSSQPLLRITRGVVLYGVQYVPVQYSVQHFSPHRFIVYVYVGIRFHVSCFMFHVRGHISPSIDRYSK